MTPLPASLTPDMNSAEPAAQPAGFSLQQRLTGLLTVLTLLVWLASTVTLFWVMHQESQEIFDHSLMESGHLLVSLAPLTHSHRALDQQILEQTSALSDVNAKNLIFQIWNRQGQLVYSSRGVGTQPIRPLHATGLQWVEMASGVRFRVYSAWDPHHDYQVQIGERWTIRRELLNGLGERLLWTALLFLPLLLLGLHGLIRQGLAPVNRLAASVNQRPSDDLTPIASAGLPRELRPLIDAFNQLLARLSDTFEHERRFTADAAHELRTPLAAIRMHAQILQRARNPAEQQEAIGDIVQGVDRATRLTEQLLTLSRLDPQLVQQHFYPIILSEWIPECLAQWPRPSQSLRLNLEPALIAGDRNSLELLLRNLLDNAARYSPPDGVIEIRCSNLPSGEVMLQVLDQGPGIAPELYDRVFDRFYRIPGTQASGSGLGLSIVQRITEQHQARLQLGPGLEGCGLGVGVIFAPVHKSQ